MMSESAVWKSAVLAKTYLDGVRGAIPLADEQIDVMLRLIDGCGIEVRRFLDLGCGGGILGAAILTRYPNSHGVFMDFSEAMLDVARASLGERHQFPLFDYGDPSWVNHVADAAPFDAIVSGYSIHHQPDDRKRAIYAEIFDLLRQGGIFVNVEHVSSPTKWGEALFNERFIDALTAFHQSRGTDSRTRDEIAAEYYHRPDKSANILAPVEDQCRWLREIGYADVDCWLKLFELAVFGGRKPWK